MNGGAEPQVLRRRFHFQLPVGMLEIVETRRRCHMADVFDNTILCSKCNTEMKKVSIAKNGFLLRAVVCPKCNDRIFHPHDMEEYSKFMDLKNKEFNVKMRMVGNSYAVSIPKEIVSFMNNQRKMMNEMVKLCFEDMGRVSLNFENSMHREKGRVVGAREVQIIKNGKPILHVKQFADSANPKNNKTEVLRGK
ncbi:MAG: hypothetical protein KGH55_03385 [Nanoarchaeota archaeon]|nr:hypothetical protein [Nanoarchaeota archaeon]